MVPAVADWLMFGLLPAGQAHGSIRQGCEGGDHGPCPGGGSQPPAAPAGGHLVARHPHVGGAGRHLPRACAPRVQDEAESQVRPADRVVAGS